MYWNPLKSKFGDIIAIIIFNRIIEDIKITTADKRVLYLSLENLEVIKSINGNNK